MLSNYYIVMYSMIALAVVVFIALLKVQAGYGILLSGKWGKTINNKVGWFLMEIPILAIMLVLWAFSPRRFDVAPLVMFLVFESHYIHRALIFPFKLKGNGKMPILIILMGLVFNSVNAYLQAGWLFYVSPEGHYPLSWLYSPQFIIGLILFYTGMGINIHSDKIIRSLRKNGDTKHYLPQTGMFKYVTSANYFGEILEWAGFALLTWSLSGLTFVLWTMANLVPRARSTHSFYKRKYPEEMARLKPKRIFPFVY